MRSSGDSGNPRDRKRYFLIRSEFLTHECLTKVTASEKALLQAKEEEITKLREQIELLQSVPSSDLPFETAETVSDQKQQSVGLCYGLSFRGLMFSRLR